jgi:nitrite reductase/ring-hydroxylating ferredoxin subunit
MFNNPPNIYAHVSALKNGHFVTEDQLILNNNGEYSIKSRECPHRGYLIQEPGDVVKTVVCKLHGFAWDSEGKPLDNAAEPCRNHFYKLHHHGPLELGKTGLLFQNFKELPDSEWVQELSKITDLEFDRTVVGESKGSWLWMMEQLTDVIHLRQNGIHPRQSLETPLDGDHIEQFLEEGCSVQKNTNINGTKGFWVFIYPGYGVEFEPGKLLITRLVPNDINEEFGFRWELQTYYSPWVDKNEREEWEKSIEVYYEDIHAIEKIKRPYFPLKRMVNQYEEQMHHWGQWYKDNLKKD